jgi:hypothetical protein
MTFLLYIPLPYINLGVIILFGSMVYNWITIWYVVLVMRAITLHSSGASNAKVSNHICRDASMWTPILRFATLSLFLRLVYQFPYIPESYDVSSWQVQFGMRKVYGTLDASKEERTVGREIVADAVVMSIAAFQVLLLRRPEVPHIVRVSKLLEPYKHRNGLKVVGSIENERDVAMEHIRTKFRQMHDFCLLVSQSREKASDEVKWEEVRLDEERSDEL